MPPFSVKGLPQRHCPGRPRAPHAGSVSRRSQERTLLSAAGPIARFWTPRTGDQAALHGLPGLTEPEELYWQKRTRVNRIEQG